MSFPIWCEMKIRTVFIALFVANSFIVEASSFNNRTSHKLTKVWKFSWENCGIPADPVYLKSLHLYPDPIPSPGYLLAGAQGSTRVELVSPLSVNVTLERKVAGVWVKIPCVDELGSCHYPNICDILDQLIPPGQDCPEPLHTNGLPCHCPFRAGDFALPSSGIYIPNFGLPAGWNNFKAQVVLSSSEKELGCIKVSFSLASSRHLNSEF